LSPRKRGAHSTKRHQKVCELIDTRQAMAEQSSEGIGEPRGKALPLNSKCLTTAQLQRIARGLEVHTTARGDELHQMVEGKLTEMGKEPRNVQVIISGAKRLSLRDDNGIFLEVDPEESVDSPGGGESTEDDDLAAIIEDLKTALAQATEENNQLKDELSHQQLESEVVKTALEEKVRTLEQEKESLREAASSTGVEELSNFRHSHQGCSIRQTAPKLFSDDLWLLSYCTDHGASGTNLS